MCHFRGRERDIERGTERERERERENRKYQGKKIKQVSGAELHDDEPRFKGITVSMLELS